MKVALIGATGNIGSKVLAELLRRGHTVTGIARHPENLSPQENLTPQKGDVNDIDGLQRLIAGHDVAISSVHFVDTNAVRLLATVKVARVPRLLVVGGAGSLEVKPGVQLVDTPDFPDAYMEEALAGREFLNVLRAEQELDWSFLSPAAMFVPGERTGTFRLGTDQLLVDEAGKSGISPEDFAVALVDELETPRHSRQRFTIGY